ncbi:MAG: hypothetical protein ABJN73_01630 [Nonlabens ulvanivorans]|uniref:Uncharacterized protein n=3 Tax=Nonlabens ulvanivorans TaxID=906888 RepID=A0A084JXJ5_NONUL|nr:hypothetical protein [Nonlabens ulvanivorans]KEZ93679.1 hypothetical protein IL45_05605 [Nonlabens ulvanivorans]PRX14270.1 hypothetical protein LY02_01300 [Nonlabens ulvanivorans]GAK75980.1 hypothetical protein JCM19296_1577 [Nonlabens ulvanivorans]
MGSGGSISSMVTIMRNNKKLFLERKERRKKRKQSQATYSQGVERKDYTLQEVENAKRKIRKQADKDKRKSLLIIIITVIAAPIVFYGIGTLLYEIMKFQSNS